MRIKLAYLLLICLVMSSMNFQPASAVTGTNEKLQQEVDTWQDEVSLDEEVTLLVELNQPSLLQQYNENNDSTVESRRFSLPSYDSYNSFSASSTGRNERTAIALQQTEVISEINSLIDNQDDIEVIRQYSDITNMIVIKVAQRDITKIKKLSDVKSVTESITYERPNIAQDLVINPGTNTGRNLIHGDNLLYKGEGMLVAVIDTGCDTQHEAFSDSITNPAYSLASINTILSSNELKCETYQANPATDASSVYCNQKIPFAYDYCDKDCNVNPTASSSAAGNDHGTHVAGIIGANGDTMKGIVPQAQLAIMKVFPDTSGGAPDYVVLDALTDCVKLNVDVINMSLGKACGYTNDESDTRNAIFTAIGNSGINLVVAAGNDYSSSYNNYFNGYPLSANPDTATVSSPSTNPAALSVASFENVEIYQPVIHLQDGTIIVYKDLASSPNDQFLSLQEGNSFIDYVIIDNTGEASDYEGVDVAGKIAVVKRGYSSFSEKLQNAANAGAIGLIVYNNLQHTSLIGMSIENYLIPSVFISYEDGQILINDQQKNLKISNYFIDNQNTDNMSNFSSWGCTPDLKLKPEITGVGGHIFSTLPFNEYGNMRGTSMSAPQIAGACAAIRQYLKQNTTVYGVMNNAIEAKRLSNNLLMSTATPCNTIGYTKDQFGITLPYSPRRQGAGLANIDAALETSTYLYNTNTYENRPVMNLGDDWTNSGVFSGQFHICNEGNQAVTYQLAPYVMTETPGISDDISYIYETPTLLDAKTSIEVSNSECSVSGSAITVVGDSSTLVTSGQLINNGVPYSVSGSSITISANTDALVTFKIELTDDDKAFLDQYFENGEFVEGFLSFHAIEGTQVDLSIPFLGFYGDWTKAPILDYTIYEAVKEGTPLPIFYNDNYYNLSPNSGITGLYSLFNYNGDVRWDTLLGQNPFSTVVNLSENYIAISPNEDGYYDSFAWIYYPIRNPKKMIYEIKTESGTVLHRQEVTGNRKSIWNSKLSRFEPYYEIIDWEGVDTNSDLLANNTRVYFEANAYVDYNEHVANINTVRLPIVIDLEKPEISDITVDETNHRLSFKVSDNQYVSDVKLVSESGELITHQNVNATQIGYDSSISFNYTQGQNNYSLVAHDYAYNWLQMFINIEDYIVTPTATPTPTTTPTTTPTPTPTTTPTATPSVPYVPTAPTPTPTLTPSVTPTVTPSVSVTPLPLETGGKHVITYDLDRAPASIVSASNIKAHLSEGENLMVEFKQNDRVKYAWSFMTEDYTKDTKLLKVKTGITVKSMDESSYNNGIDILFAQRAAFGMEAKVKLDVSNNFRANDKVYLYKKGNDGKLLCVPNSSYKVDQNGYVELNIVTGGDYVLLNKVAASSDKISVLKQVQVDSSISCKAGKKASIDVELPDALTYVSKLELFTKDTSQASYGAVITYKSSNKSIATVSKTGAVTGKKKGTTTITVTVKLSNGTEKSYKTKVTVK